MYEPYSSYSQTTHHQEEMRQEAASDRLARRLRREGTAVQEHARTGSRLKRAMLAVLLAVTTSGVGFTVARVSGQHLSPIAPTSHIQGVGGSGGRALSE